MNQNNDLHNSVESKDFEGIKHGQTVNSTGLF